MERGVESGAMRFLRRREGFSIVEVMVVLVIMAILVGIAIPVFFNSRRNAYKRACMSNQRTVDGLVEAYRALSREEFGADEWPTSLQDLKDHEWLKTVPTCPVNNTPYIWEDGPPPYIRCRAVPNHNEP